MAEREKNLVCEKFDRKCGVAPAKNISSSIQTEMHSFLVFAFDCGKIEVLYNACFVLSNDILCRRYGFIFSVVRFPFPMEW